MIAIILLCLFLPNPIRQNKGTHPDLSGTWILVSSKSNFEKQKDTTDYTVTIIQREPEIKFVKKYKLKGVDGVEQWSYYTDGRPQGFEVKVETHWRGRKLFTSMNPSGVNMANEDEWELSKDGSLLTRIVTSSTYPGTTGMQRTPHEPVINKYVFTRKQP